MTFRPSRIWAVTQRDLALQMKGSRGLLIPLVLAGLLLPIAVYPTRGDEKPPPPTFFVGGKVPEAVLALPTVKRGEHGVDAEFFAPTAEKPLTVRARGIDPEIREVLDGDDPKAVSITHVFPPFIIPERGLLLALITASIIAGTVAEALPGERARKTLESLLTAGITRAELIVGKWLAWGGLGSVAVGIAGSLAVVLGRTPIGSWLVPMLLVPPCTIAIGFWLVRRSSDVVGGATVSVRVLPALVGAAAIVAWLAGNVHPWLGAAIPLGGALLAAGVSWADPLCALIATLATGAATVAMLALTIRDLEGNASGREPAATNAQMGVALIAAAAAGWWMPVVGPVLWATGGNPHFEQDLPAGVGMRAGTSVLAVTAVVFAFAAQNPALIYRWKRAGWVDGLAATVAGVLLAGFGSIAAIRPVFEHPAITDAAQRLTTAEDPPLSVSMHIAVVAQELLFRGALPQLVGPWVAGVAWIAVFYPYDPLMGLLSGILLGVLAQRSNSVVPAIIAHLVWRWVSAA